MPFGGNDWLALTQEPALEPELPICDPHHHFWDYRTARIPYQRYLLHELADDMNSGHNVRSTVFIEARAMYRADGPEEMKPVGEVEFVQGLACGQCEWVVWPRPRRRRDCRPCQSAVGRPGGTGARSVAGGESQPVSRDSSLGDVGLPSGAGEHGLPIICRVNWPMNRFGPGHGCSPAWGLPLKVGCFFPSCPS